MRGNALEVDLILKAAGVEAEPTPLRNFLKARCDANGSIRVNRLLQVPSLLNTWAVGDCASTGEMHTISVTTMHAKVVARNILAYVKGEPLMEHKPPPVNGMVCVCVCVKQGSASCVCKALTRALLRADHPTRGRRWDRVHRR